MKNLVTIIAFSFFSLHLIAKELCDGYVIMLNNDTVKCKINIPKDLDLFNKVVTQDSSGKKQTYHAADLKVIGFGFMYENKQYVYSVKTSNDWETNFYIVKAIGKINLYYRYDFINTGTGYASYRSDVFILENANKETVTVKGGIFSAYKKKIKAFLKDDPGALKLFEEKVSTITDIEDFVRNLDGYKD